MSRTMNGATLKAARTLLHYTQDEAAALIGAVSTRSWNYWETDGRPVPADVADKIRSLCAWRANAIQAATAQMAAARAALPDDADMKPTALLWYATAADWASLPGRDPVLWRPHQAVVAELIGSHGCVAVPFEADPYRRWLGARTDTEALRGAWTAAEADQLDTLH